MTRKQSSSLRNGKRHPLRDRKKRAKFAATSSQCWSIFFDIRGIVHKEFVLPDQTVSGKFYCEVLRRLRENVRRKRPEMRKNGDWLLHRDNAPALTSLTVREFLTRNNMITVPHPAYSPDLPLAISACSLKWNCGWKGGVSYPVKISKQNRNGY